MGDNRGARRRVRRVVALIAAAATAVALAACTGVVDPGARYDAVDGPLPNETAEALRAALVETVAMSGSSGGLAAVSAPWSGEWSTAVGHVGFDEGDPPVSESTDFRLGPATTQVTCLILLRLAERDVVELDDQVDEYVEDIPGLDGITLEQLCRHMSGLRDYSAGLRTSFVSNPVRVWPAGELIASSLATSRVDAPGKTWSPSSTGILLLAMALERATHRDWAALAEEHVFGPLDIDGISLPAPTDVDHRGVLDAYVQGRFPDGSPDCAVRIDTSRQSSSIGGEAAGAIATLEDAVVLSQGFATGALLSEETAGEQFERTRTFTGAPGWYGQLIGGREFGPLRGTADETLGALTATFSDPDSGLTVVVAVNNSTAGSEYIQQAAFALASIASKAQAAEDRTHPLVELPWSLEQARQRMAELGRCPVQVPGEQPAG